PAPFRIGTATPPPKNEKGRSVAVAATVPASSVSVSTRIFMLRECFIGFFLLQSHCKVFFALRAKVTVEHKTSHFERTKQNVPERARYKEGQKLTVNSRTRKSQTD